jgi:hypothetical protein
MIKKVWGVLPDGTKYRTLGVPGASTFGSSAYHAYSAIMSLHFGWLAPFIRKSSKKKVMSFPVSNGQAISRGKGSGFVYTKTAFQVQNQKRNQWILNVMNNNFTTLNDIYKANLEKANLRRKKIEIVRR